MALNQVNPARYIKLGTRGYRAAQEARQASKATHALSTGKGVVAQGGQKVAAKSGLKSGAGVTKSADNLAGYAHNYQKSVGASQRVPQVLQSGGNKLSNRVADGLNEHFGENITKRDWGRALEGLKKDTGLRNDHHGRILDNGDYINDAGDLIGNIADYLP